MTFEFETNLVF